MASELSLIVRWQYGYVVCGVPGGPTSERCHPGCNLGCEVGLLVLCVVWVVGRGLWVVGCGSWVVGCGSWVVTAVQLVVVFDNTAA